MCPRDAERGSRQCRPSELSSQRKHRGTAAEDTEGRATEDTEDTEIFWIVLSARVLTTTGR
jgi:hypothetical protein